MGKIKNCFKKVGDWCADNFELILMGGMAISGLTVGYILGKDHGYVAAFNEAKVVTMEKIGNTIATTGYCMADMATRLVEENPNLYDLIKTDHDSAVEFICKKFDESTASQIFNAYTGGKA